MRTATLIALVLVAVFALLPPPAGGDAALPTAAQGEGKVTLTLLHNNDGESALLPLTNAVEVDGATLEVPVAGIAAYGAVFEAEVAQARAAGNAVLAVYAGDAYLSSAAFICGPARGQPVLRRRRPARHRIRRPHHRNHEFDSTPDILERFIRSFGDQPFLSANLDFSAEPGFADLVDDDGLIELPVSDGRVVGRSMIIEDSTTGARFGLVGATTSGPDHNLHTAACHRHPRPRHDRGCRADRDRSPPRAGGRQGRLCQPPPGRCHRYCDPGLAAGRRYRRFRRWARPSPEPRRGSIPPAPARRARPARGRVPASGLRTPPAEPSTS